MRPRFDVAIVGAGCAGLSLAWHLLDRGIDPARLVLFDPRARYERDRTWCFFEVWPHPFEGLVTHRWARWRVRARGPWVERGADATPYAHLPSDAFYRAVLERLGRQGVALRLGVTARGVDERADAACVHTDAGSFEARWVFDSRPALGHPAGEVSLLQHFEGWEVRTSSDRFEAGVATLMDFAVPQDLGLSFLYVLPFDRRRALVEATWFSPARPEWSVHRARLERSLDGTPYEILHRERGVIPMTTAPAAVRRGSRVHPIGLAGGLAKPSTGYAFVDIQRASAAIAERLVAGEPPAPSVPRPWLSRFQDRVFLAYLSRHPSAAADALVGLFERLPDALVPRFLHDRVGVAERLRVMRAMPVGAMAAEVVRSAPIWMRA